MRLSFSSSFRPFNRASQRHLVKIRGRLQSLILIRTAALTLRAALAGSLCRSDPFGVSLGPRMEQAASRIQDSRDCSCFFALLLARMDFSSLKTEISDATW